MQTENKIMFKPNDPTSASKIDVEFRLIKGILSFVIYFSHVQSYLCFCYCLRPRNWSIDMEIDMSFIAFKHFASVYFVTINLFYVFWEKKGGGVFL